METIVAKTGRSAGKELLDAMPASKKGAELIWDLDAIAAAGVDDGAFLRGLNRRRRT